MRDSVRNRELVWCSRRYDRTGSVATESGVILLTLTDKRAA
jgi:hypothetical protein